MPQNEEAPEALADQEEGAEAFDFFMEEDTVDLAAAIGSSNMVSRAELEGLEQTVW